MNVNSPTYDRIMTDARRIQRPGESETDAMVRLLNDRPERYRAYRDADNAAPPVGHTPRLDPTTAARNRIYAAHIEPAARRYAEQHGGALPEGVVHVLDTDARLRGLVEQTWRGGAMVQRNPAWDEITRQAAALMRRASTGGTPRSFAEAVTMVVGRDPALYERYRDLDRPSGAMPESPPAAPARMTEPASDPEPAATEPLNTEARFVEELIRGQVRRVRRDDPSLTWERATQRVVTETPMLHTALRAAREFDGMLAARAARARA
jgi:hypothetical protein